MDTHIELLLLVWPSREYRVGDPITVDGGPAIIRRIKMDSGTVLHADIEVYPSREARDAALSKRQVRRDVRPFPRKAS